MPPANIRQRPAKPSPGHLPSALLPPLPKQIQRVDRADGDVDVRPGLAAPVQKGPAAGAEAAGVAWRAVEVLEGRRGRGCPLEVGEGDLLPDEEEVRGGAAALGALACSALRGGGVSVRGLEGLGIGRGGRIRCP